MILIKKIEIVSGHWDILLCSGWLPIWALLYFISKSYVKRSGVLGLESYRLLCFGIHHIKIDLAGNLPEALEESLFPFVLRESLTLVLQGRTGLKSGQKWEKHLFFPCNYLMERIYIVFFQTLGHDPLMMATF